MTQETGLVVRERESALDVYGDGQDIKRLAERIRLCLPGGDKLQNHEALALSQLSVAYQLNPFNGEVWYIPGRGTQVGIKGLRKTAHRQSRYWTYFVALTTEERTANGVPDGAIAYRCELYRTDLILESAKVIKAMNEAGMRDAADRYAYRPSIGIGYFIRGEASKMKADQAARKRAEADALKQAFDLPFASEIGNGSTVGYVDTEWAEVEEAHAPAGPHVDLYGDRDLEDEPVLVGLTDTAPPTVGERALAQADEPSVPNNPTGLVAAVNAVTNGYYHSIPHLLNACGRKNWPAPQNADEWHQCYDLGIAHAREKRAEGQHVLDLVDQGVAEMDRPR